MAVCPSYNFLYFSFGSFPKKRFSCALGHNALFLFLTRNIGKRYCLYGILPLWYSLPYMHASCGFVRKSVELPYKNNNNGTKSTLVELGPESNRRHLSSSNIAKSIFLYENPFSA